MEPESMFSSCVAHLIPPDIFEIHHVLPLCNSSSFFFCVVLFCVNIPQLIHSNIDRLFFICKQEVTMNSPAHVFGRHMHLLLLSIIQEVELLGHEIGLLTFHKSCQFSKIVMHI